MQGAGHAPLKTFNVMWKSPGTPVPIHASQLVPGLYVWLDVPWDDHPFISNRLLIKTPGDITLIQSLHVDGRLYYHPDKSTAAPAPFVDPLTCPHAQAVAAEAAEKAAAEESKRLNQLKHALQRQHKDAAVRADRAWENAARETREALLTLGRSPKSAGGLLANLSRQTAAAIAASQEVLLHLLGDKQEQGPQFHALNVLTLCMVLGKKRGLQEDALADLALSALAHDVGKAQIPLQILQNPSRKKFEEDHYRQHVLFGVQLAVQSGAFPRGALSIMAEHHEAADGSGWPNGHRHPSQSAQILSLVNRYDNLCTPQTLGTEALMPAEALAHIYHHERSRYDAGILTALIRLLGVYPPGTVVQLTDGSLALVVAPGPDSLHPEVLIYTPEVHKDEAPVLQLDTRSDVQIAEAVKPSTLPPQVRTWLNPQQRLSYFYSVDKTTA